MPRRSMSRRNRRCGGVLLVLGLMAAGPASAAPAAVSEPGAGRGATPNMGLSAWWPAYYTERYAAGGVQTTAAGGPALGARWEGPLSWPTSPEPFPKGLFAPGWWGSATFGSLATGFQDRDLPLSAHWRQEYRADAWLGRQGRVPGVAYTLGLGYALRYEAAQHSGAPAGPSYAFSAFRLFHGPELVGRLDGDLARLTPEVAGWSIRLDMRFSPVLFSYLEAGLPALPFLSNAQLDLGVRKELGTWVLGGGYRRWQMFGRNYDETLQGPYLSLEGRLAP